MVFKNYCFLFGAVVCGLLIFFPSNGSAISCFQCSSRTDPECATISSNATSSPYYRECRGQQHPQHTNIHNIQSKKEFFCRKIYQKIHDLGDMEFVVRKCGWVPHPKGECYFVTEPSHTEVVCQCFTDGCNSAEKSVLSLSAIASSVLIAILYR